MFNFVVAMVEHNAVLVEGAMPGSISVRFPATSAFVRQNLTDRPVAARDGARLVEQNNIADARPDWFLDPDRGDPRPARADLPPVDAAVADPGGEVPYAGNAPDVGAYEFRGGR